VRLDIRRIGQVKTDGDEANGTRVRVKVVKNKLAPPFRKAEFEVLFGTGINIGGELIDLGTEQGRVKKSGSWYSCGDQRLGQGRERAVAHLDDHPELADYLRQCILTPEDAPKAPPLPAPGPPPKPAPPPAPASASASQDPDAAAKQTA